MLKKFVHLSVQTYFARHMKDLPVHHPSAPALRRRIEEMSERKLADFSSALIPGAGRPVLGCRVPQLRRLARELVCGDWRRLLDEELGDESHEEVLLHGFIIGYARMEAEERLERIRAFVPLADNWALCDCCCASFDKVRKFREKAWPFVLECARSKEEFRQRFGIVMMMDHFLTDEYADSVLAELAALKPAGYYATMGGAWALSVTFLKHTGPTLRVLRRNDTDTEMRRLACRKILESRRTPPQLRFLIKELRASLPKNTAS